MKKNVVKEKSFNFALSIVRVYKILVSEKKEFVMSKQLLRSGTSVGAMIREAEHAESRQDFIHKCSISLKEANETDYWIDLLNQSGYLENDSFRKLKEDITEILKLLTAIIKSSKLK